MVLTFRRDRGFKFNFKFQASTVQMLCMAKDFVHYFVTNTASIDMKYGLVQTLSRMEMMVATAP